MTIPPLRLPLIAALISGAVCLGFAAFTGHIWEDYFITFRSSLNLATGQGFVFQPGERVHSFTSPLGTLLPALFALPGGDNVAVNALWCFRVVSALALGGALWLAVRTMTASEVGLFAATVAALAWALDPKTVDFSINGMESALVVLFVVVSWKGFADGARLLPCVVGLAGLQWTRPDGCVLFSAVAAAWLLFGGPRDLAGWRSRIRTLVPIGVLAVALYLPWLLFAWIYFGSPIPHTIVAKVAHHGPGELAGALALYPWRLLFGQVGLHSVFMPTYFVLGGWPPWLIWISRFAAVAAALAWLVPGLRPAGRIASFAFFLGGFYVEYIPRSPWYYPGWQAMAFVSFGYLLDATLRATGRAAWMQRPARILATTGVCLQLGLLLAVGWQMRAQQTTIEYGQRREIGRWLRAQAAPGDRVFLECLGYIGFFSGLKMLDYPGLSSPEVVAARRAGHQSFAQIISALRPEWLVLRPHEVFGVHSETPALLTGDYRLAESFDTRAAVNAISFLPGRGYLEFDARFLIFQRTAPR